MEYREGLKLRLKSLDRNEYPFETTDQLETVLIDIDREVTQEKRNFLFNRAIENVIIRPKESDRVRESKHSQLKMAKISEEANESEVS